MTVTYFKSERYTIAVASRVVRNELEARDKAEPNAEPMRHDWRDALKLVKKDTGSIRGADVAILAAFAAGVRNPLPMHVLRRKLGEGERIAHMLGAEAHDRSPICSNLLAWCDKAAEAHAAAIARPRVCTAPRPVAPKPPCTPQALQRVKAFPASIQLAREWREEFDRAC